VDAVVATARIALLLLATWSLASVIVAVPIAALFRFQARIEELWQRAQRRRVWLDASRPG
jgi:hypothetical protein